MPSPAPQNTIDFVARIRAAFGVDERGRSDEETAPLRYVIYARKSTDTAEKQERSIGDQIVECRQAAERQGLRVVAFHHEEKSAKMSDNRPIFRTMLDNILKGEYDAILTWAPDRLARNMKEAGEVIDLLDRGDIKDIKFANGYYFNNDAAGKMMLGIAFVQAKQFSDQHSQNVKRGVNRITAEGKFYDRPKHGYYKDSSGYARPDGENWQLLKRVFEMRLSKEHKRSLNEIATWLREQGYPVKTSHPSRKRVKVSVNFLSDVFRDPFYAGAYVFGGQVINLFEKFDFQPIITPEEFDMLARDNGPHKKFRLADVIKPRGSIMADLMRGMVICGGCKHPMSTGITPKKLPDGIRRYFYFRCDTLDCKYKGKSIRAKSILEAAYAFLDGHPMNLERGYAAYTREMERLQAERDKELQAKQKSLHQRRKALSERISETKNLLGQSENDKVLIKEFKADLKKQLEELKKFDGQIVEVEEARRGGKAAIQSFAEFIELFQNLADRIKKIGTMADLDYTMRKVFMNFVVEGQKVTNITQNSPFRELCGTLDSGLVAPRGIEPLSAP